MLLHEFHCDIGERAAESDSGASSLHLAALAGHHALVRLLIAAGASSFWKDSNGLSPMHYAALSKGRVQSERQHEVMKALAHDGGEGLWQQSDARGATVLHYVAASGDLDLAEWL